MPTFTAIALDRLLEQGGSKSAADSRLDRRSNMPARANGSAVDDSRPVSIPNRKPSIPVPPTHSNLVRRNSSDSAGPAEKKAQWLQISPALYATPASTPLPDSPTSFPPSPYIINHKRRGPRLQKSFSDSSVMGDKNVATSSHSTDTEIETHPSSAVVDDVPTGSKPVEEKAVNGFHEEKISNGVVLEANCEQRDVPAVGLVEKESEGEFYDAWEELSSESGRQAQSSLRDLESEVREMRLSLLMEIENRRQAEGTLNNMQIQYQNLREKLREVGLILPTDLSTISQDAQANNDSIEDICQQVYTTRCVSESIGRGVARAECEEEMEAQLESKNFEIARLCDRLHYYETMNQEMSYRNQEAIELARRDRQKRQRTQKWVWGTIITAITLGSAALAWSYFPNSKGTSSPPEHHAAESDTTTE